MAVLSISRQFGAGGKTLGEELAKRLGYRMADDELVALVAEKAGVSDEWVQVMEREREQSNQGFVSSLLSTRTIEWFFGKTSAKIDDEAMAQYFRGLIPEIAARDNVIFVDRGSQFILPSNSRHIKILLVATQERRVTFLMKRYRLSEKDAWQTVKDWEENRNQFLKIFTSRNPDDPSVYDMVINTGFTPIEWAVDFIADLLRKRSGL